VKVKDSNSCAVKPMPSAGSGDPHFPTSPSSVLIFPCITAQGLSFRAPGIYLLFDTPFGSGQRPRSSSPPLFCNLFLVKVVIEISFVFSDSYLHLNLRPTFFYFFSKAHRKPPLSLLLLSFRDFSFGFIFSDYALPHPRRRPALR